MEYFIGVEKKAPLACIMLTRDIVGFVLTNVELASIFSANFSPLECCTDNEALVAPVLPEYQVSCTQRNSRSVDPSSFG